MTVWVVRRSSGDIVFKDSKDAFAKAKEYLMNEVECDEIVETVINDGLVCFEGSFVHHLGVVKIYCLRQEVK